MKVYLRHSLPLLKELRDTLPHGGRAASGGHFPGWAEIIGVDEAGRGCLAGPVVAGAVLFPEGMDFKGRLPGLADSKKLSEKQRRELADPICAASVAYGIGVVWQDEIDRINILAATFRAMSRAVLALAGRLEDTFGSGFLLPRLCIDGNFVIPQDHWHFCLRGIAADALGWEQYLPQLLTRLPAHGYELPEQECVVDGDALIPAISAASVLAKTVRDGLMERLDGFYPGYGLARHKGYGTKEHRAILASKGPCPLHRQSFRHVKPDNGKAVERQGLLM